MIDEKLIKQSAEFCTEWNTLFSEHPRYQLDLSWPTLGIIDLLTVPLRGRADYNAEEKNLLLNCGIYIAGLAHDCWATFPDQVKPNLIFQEMPESEIILEATEGQHLPNKGKFQVKLLSAISGILKNPTIPFPFFEKTTRPINISSNLISSFTIGLATGLCPYGEGPWKDKSDNEMFLYLLSAGARLSRSAANYYKRCYPSEPVGQQETLYHADLIIPPLYHAGEPYPALRAASALTRKLKSLELSEDQMIAVTTNLAQSPDELIRCAGFAVAAALSQSPASNILKTIGQTLDDYRFALRPAIYTARMELEKPADWLSAVEKGDLQTARKIAALEIELGLLPQFSLPLEYLRFKDLLPLFQQLVWGNSKTVREMIDQLFGIRTSADLVLLGIEMDLLHGDLERAGKELTKLTENILTENSSYAPRLFYLEGIIAIQSKNYEEAVIFLNKCWKSKSTETTLRISIGNTLSSLLNLLSHYQDSLEVSNQVLVLDPSSVEAMFNRLKSLEILDQPEEAKEQVYKLSRLVPFYPKVFAKMLEYSL